MLFASCVAILAESVACLLMERHGPTSWKHIISGSPRYSWWVGGFHQAIVFPACALLALWPVLTGKTTLDTWLHWTWDDDENSGCFYLHIALLSYWAKDCIVVKLPALIWVHHIVCLFSVTASMAGLLARSTAVYTLGATALELGSLANTVCELLPGLRVRLCMLGPMSISNLFSICLVVWYAWTFEGRGAQLASWWAAAACGTVLSIIRQQEFHGRMRQDFALRAKGA